VTLTGTDSFLDAVNLTLFPELVVNETFTGLVTFLVAMKDTFLVLGDLLAILVVPLAFVSLVNLSMYISCGAHSAYQ